MKNWLLRIVLLLVGICGLAQGRSLTPAVEDSLHAIHPRLRAHWLKERGIDAPGYTKPFQPDSLNMRCVGRWSYGPSYDVTGRITDHDTIVFLARGSGISVLQFHGGNQPSVTLLSDINAMRLVRRVVVQDSWLFVGSTGFEIYNVAQPANPVKVSWTNATLNDLAVLGSYLYSTSDDSFKVFDISNKTSPVLVGTVRDSGTTVAAANGKAYLLWGTFGWHGMYILDVGNPAAPHRAGIWGSEVDAVAARGNLCYEVGGDRRFHILDVTDPGSPRELSSIGAAGRAIHLQDGLAYTTNFAVVDIMDSLAPGVVGTCTIPGGSGIWAAGNYSYVFFSCYVDGLGVVDCRDPAHPVMDTVEILAYDASRDISVVGSHAVVANNADGVKLLNITDPAHPFQTASYDTVGPRPACKAAVLSGSLAYIGWLDWWQTPELYVLSLADSERPVMVGRTSLYYPIEAVTIRDSWCFAGEGSWFEVISVRDSLQPAIACRCTLRNLASVFGVQVLGNIVYVANADGGLRMIDVSSPRNATPVGSYVPASYSYGMAVQDTVAFIGTDQGLSVASVASPSTPYQIALYPCGGVYNVALQNTLAYVTGPQQILDVSDPTNPRPIGGYGNGPASGPICWKDSLIYVACYDDGVSILRYTGPGSGVVGVPITQATHDRLSVYPNPSRGLCFLRNLPSGLRIRSCGLHDVSGRLVRRFGADELHDGVLDLRNFAPGAYFVKDDDGGLCRIALIR